MGAAFRAWRTGVVTLLTMASVGGAAERFVWMDSPTPSSPYATWSNAAHTIPEAIDAATPGDTIWVTNGVYVLASQLSITANVTLQSVNGAAVTVLDGNHSVGCLYLNHAGAVVRGFTVTQGSAGTGGGILLYGGLVANCIIRGNGAAQGGGVYAANSVALRNCLIAGNTAPSGGGGLAAQSGVSLDSCTIAANASASGSGGGVLVQGGQVWLRNCILYGNAAASGSNWFSSGVLTAEWCCTAPALGNSFSTDPRFVSPATDNYRLQSGSPCIDSGTNLAWMAGATDVTGSPRVQDGNRDGVTQADLGAFEMPSRFIGPWPGTQPVAAGADHSLGLLGNGQVLAWGNDTYGQCAVPAPNGDFVAVAASYRYSLGLKSDGTIAGWGDNSYGKHDVPAPNMNFTAVTAGNSHAAGLKSDGTVVVWGDNTYGQRNIPPPNTNFIAVACGANHSLGLKADGSIVGWGYNGQLQCTVPEPNTNFVAIAAGSSHSLGLKADGRIIAWGPYGTFGQTNVPSPNAGFTAVAAGSEHSLGLKTNGVVAAWGRWFEGETTVPEPNTGFVAAAGGSIHSLALQADGRLTAWGDNTSGQTNVPSPALGFGQASGVVPPLGSCAGGTRVAILGENLCEHGDVTNVTVCGVAASIVAATANRVVVMTASNAAATGDVAVYSSTYGAIVKSNAYTYAILNVAVLGTNGTSVANGEAPSPAKGTDFGHVLAGMSVTNSLSITNSGDAALSIGGLTMTGVAGARFQVSGLPATVAAGGVSHFTVGYAPVEAGVDEAALLIANDATNYTVNLRGSAVALSTLSGPFAGGNAIAITNGVLGNGADITNVLVGGMSATITGQGANWVTIVVPATGSAGVKDVVVQSASVGVTTLAGAYTVNPAGQIGGQLVRDWTRWQLVAALPAARMYFAAGALNGSLYTVGGQNSAAVEQSTVYQYDGTNWAETAALPTARYALAAEVLDGGLYAVGGYGSGGARTNVYRYNGTDWAEVAGLPGGRGYLGVGVLNGAMYAVGGYAGAAQTNVYRYNGTNWTEVTGLPQARFRVGVGVLNGALYAVGGSEFGSALTNVYRYNGTNWAEVAGLPAARSDLGVGVLDGALYAVGGYNGGSKTNVYRYNGTNWAEVVALPAAKFGLATGVFRGALYAMGGQDDWIVRTASVYRYPSATNDPGVAPSGGSITGGYPVVLSGLDLGNGTDITNVTLCGASVSTISSQSATQVIVVAGVGPPGMGSVQVFSITYGQTVTSNAFTYVGPGIAVLGTNRTLIVSGEAASCEKGTDFDHVLVGLSKTNTLAITNSGNATLTISGVTTSGVSAARFQVSGVPATLSPGSVSSFTVRYAPTEGGLDEAALLISNNSANYTVNLRGSAAALSMPVGPFAGGNAVTITNGLLGSGSDITNVLVGDMVTTIAGQGANWVTIVVPATGSAGVKDVIIQSASLGATVLAGAYTVNPAGQIGGVTEYWTQWQEVAGLPSQRYGLAAGVLNGALYAVGGADNDGTIRTNVYRYNGTNWAEIAGLPAARSQLAAGVVNGALYAVGGGDTNATARANVYRYDGTNWSEAAGLPAARRILAASVLDAKLYAVGGFDVAAKTNVYVYDGTNWSQSMSLPISLYALAAATLNDSLYTIGGIHGASRVATVYRYDQGNWTGGGMNLPAIRSDMAAGVMNGALYAIGGYGSAAPATNVYRYNGTNWTEVAGLPAPRFSMAAGVLNGALYAIGGHSGSATQTNVYRYPHTVVDPGVAPSSGSVTGGYSIVITGLNLGNGSDVTNVALCGTSVAGIVSQSATQVVVVAGVGEPGLGAVQVFSTSFGLTTKSNAFTYTGLGFAVRGTNGALIASGEAPSREKGTDFGHMLIGTARTNTLSITNSGNAALTILGVTTSGVSGVRFEVSGVPMTVAPGGVSNFTVRYAPTEGGLDDAALLIVNDATNYTVNLCGSAVALSMSAGRFAGGNAITITNGALGDGSDITNVLVGGTATTITGQGENWVTILVQATGSAGVKDVVIQSASVGDTTLTGAYTVNPAGQIAGMIEDWMQWQEVAGLPAARVGLAAGVLNGSLYAIGGHNGSSYVTNVYRFEGTSWVEVAGLPMAFGNMGAGVLGGALYVVGGYASGPRTNVYRFDGTNWTEVAGLPVPRYAHAAGVLNGALYVVSGANELGVQPHVYRYDGTNWTEAAELPAARAYHAAGVLNGALYALGGSASSGYAQPNVYRFDGEHWTEVTGLPAPRWALAAGVLNGALYAISGHDGDNFATNVYRMDGTNWTEVAGLPSARYGLAAGVLDGALYAIGGSDISSARTNVYRYPGVTGTSGVVPASGSHGGGYPVIITGSNLGNGSDITNVTLCGVPVAGIISQSATQVVVTAGAGDPGVGAVRVFSTSFGQTVESSAFTYYGSPTVRTLPVEDITSTNASGSGEVTADGFDPVTARGLCWGTATNPTLADAFVTVGSGTGIFSGVAITNLTPATLYHARAWATNAAGVSYGADVPFGTACRITATVGDHGGITPSGTIEVVYGSNQTFAITAEPDYHISDVVADGASIGATSSVRFLSVTTNHTIHATFQADALYEGPRYIGRRRTAEFIAGGGYHSLAVRSDGTILAWGDNTYGQCGVPAPNSNFMAVAGGAIHSLGLKSDGRVVTWGFSGYGLGTVPAPNSNFVAVAGGENHSVGLKSDGSIVAWGDNSHGRCDVPTPNSNFVAVAEGGYHSVGLKSDGRLVAWGKNTDGQCDAPAPNSNFVAVAGGGFHTLGLKSDGSGVAWGANWYGQCDVPGPNSTFVAVAGGDGHSLGLKADGSIVAWGHSQYGQTNAPVPNAGFGQETGVVPVRGPIEGSSIVTVYGANLGNGSDVTNVTFCGVTAAILSQSSTRIVVQTGAAPGPTNGDVVVYSSHYGPVTRTNGFTYYALHALTATAGPHGQVSPTSTDVVSFADAVFTVTPDVWYHIEELRTNGLSAGSNLGSAPCLFTWQNVTDTGTLQATFAENLAPLGTPEWWLAQHDLTNDFVAAETNDADEDGFTSGDEFAAATDPTNKASFFRIESFSVVPPEWRVYVPSVSGRVYTMHYGSDLSGNSWTNLPGQTDVPGTGGLLPLVDTNGPERGFYRIDVRRP